jgi:hypothetical protein
VQFSAFLFSDGTHYGLSVVSDGSNLPRLINDKKWRPMRVEIASLRELNDYTADITAHFNLLSRGYHFCKMDITPRAQQGTTSNDQSAVWPRR